MAFQTYFNEALFTTATPLTKQAQNKQLRDIAIDTLITELDDIRDRADRATTKLRKLRPLLPTAEETRKNRNR